MATSWRRRLYGFMWPLRRGTLTAPLVVVSGQITGGGGMRLVPCGFSLLGSVTRWSSALACTAHIPLMRGAVAADIHLGAVKGVSCNCEL